jgi:hypothetical protein
MNRDSLEFNTAGVVTDHDIITTDVTVAIGV